MKTAENTWRCTEPQDAWKIGRISRKWSETPKENFLMPKYKKSQTKGKDYGNL